MISDAAERLDFRAGDGNSLMVAIDGEAIYSRRPFPLREFCLAASQWSSQVDDRAHCRAFIFEADGSFLRIEPRTPAGWHINSSTPIRVSNQLFTLAAVREALSALMGECEPR